MCFLVYIQAFGFAHISDCFKLKRSADAFVAKYATISLTHSILSSAVTTTTFVVAKLGISFLHLSSV